jgi:hypothetical protein
MLLEVIMKELKSHYIDTLDSINTIIGSLTLITFEMVEVINYIW